MFHQIPAVGLKPAGGIKGPWAREKSRVVVREEGGHADRGAWRDRPRAVMQGVVRMDALEAMHDTVAETETLVDDGGEIREGFELEEEGRDSGVGDCGFEFRE